jgi:hypothetical protein
MIDVDYRKMQKYSSVDYKKKVGAVEPAKFVCARVYNATTGNHLHSQYVHSMR